MAVLGLIGPTEETPPIVCITASELARRCGAVLREVALGAVIRVEDARSGTVVAWLSLDPPASVAAVADMLPEPGTVHDHLALDPPPMAQS